MKIVIKYKNVVTKVIKKYNGDFFNYLYDNVEFTNPRKEKQL